MNEELKDNPFESLESLILSGSEKERIRGNIRGFIARNRRRHWYGWFARHATASLTLALVLSGSGVMLAADSASPDSKLFGVRTHINDKVRVASVRDEDERIERELQILGRYIEEEELLADREFSL